MSTEAIVNITDVEPRAVKILAGDLRVTDKVFDTFGGVHDLVYVRKYVHVVRFRRDDVPASYTESFDVDRTMTVLR